MLHRLVSNIYAGIKDFFRPSVIDGRLNHVHLALATRCYQIQSRIFRIPDRFGFISPGPPRLQVEEGVIFIIMVFFISQMVFYGGILVFLVSLKDDRPVKSFAVLICLLIIGMVGIIWLSLYFSSRRVPGYVWEDWKTRTE